MLYPSDYNWLVLTLALLLSILLTVTFARKVFADLRHPGISFLVAWIMVFTLLGIPVINYSNLTYFGLFFIFANVSLIFMGSMISGSLKMAAVPALKLDISVVRTLAWISFSVALYYQQTRFGLRNLIFNPGLVRSSDDGGTGFLGILVYSPMVCWTLLLTIFFWNKSRKLKSPLNLPDWVFIVLCFSYMLILPERTTLLNTVAWTAFSIWMTLPKRQVASFRLMTRVFLPSAVMVLFALGFFISVSERTGKVAAVNNIRFALNPQLRVSDSLVDPYLYLTGSVPALNGILTHSLEKEPALNLAPERTMLFFRRTLQVFTGSDSTLTANAEYTKIPFPFNTYSMFYDPVLDFGLIGAVFYSLILGLIVGYVYKLTIINNSVITCFIYGWAASGLIFGIMTNKFSGIYYTFSLLLVLALVLVSWILPARATKNTKRQHATSSFKSFQSE